MNILWALLLSISIEYFVLKPLNLSFEYSSSVLVLIIYTLLSYYEYLKKDKNKRTSLKLEPCGPLRKYPLIVYFIFTLSATLSIINPFQFVQMTRQLVGELYMRILNLKKSDNQTNVIQNIFSLPFDDTFYVFSGGHDKVNSHSWNLISQRYAYDFVIIDSEGLRHSGSGLHKHDYFCYSKPILAVADGYVCRVNGNIRDAPFVGTYIIDFLCRNFVGNHVVIKHSDNVYSLYAHLAPKTVCVTLGDKVLRGQVIGCCGNSGHSTEPHLHFQMQTSPDILFTQALPVEFSNVVINGQYESGAIAIGSGDLVKNHF